MHLGDAAIQSQICTVSIAEGYEEGSSVIQSRICTCRWPARSYHDRVI